MRIPYSYWYSQQHERLASYSQVPEFDNHIQIHKLIQNSFCTHRAWGRHLIRYEESSDCCLCFFPVDNTARPDPSTEQLRSKLAAAILCEPHVRELVPFTWLAMLSRLRVHAAKHKSIALSEVRVLAAACGVPAMEELQALLLFNELGFVMYHSEPELCDLVVLNPATFIVEPASRLVCRLDVHAATSQLHSEACSDLPDDYTLLRDHGRLSLRLLEALWRDEQEHWAELRVLMVRYGLMVPASGQSADGYNANEFIVPAVLPNTVISARPSWQVVARAVILFGAKQYLGKKGKWTLLGWATAKEAARDGFLPAGLFAQVHPTVSLRVAPTDPGITSSRQCYAGSFRVLWCAKGTHLNYLCVHH